MRVQYPKLYNMTRLLALNVLLLPKDLTIIFILNGKMCFMIYVADKKKNVQVGKDQYAQVSDA